MGWPNPSLTRWLGVPTRPVVEDGLRLTVHDVVKDFRAKPLTRVSGSWFWRYEDEKEAHAWIRCTVLLVDEHQGTLILDYQRNGVPMHQLFALESTACRFGGRKWFAKCPVSGKRCSMLYSLGESGFQSRHVSRAAYRCQNESKYFDRAVRQRNKVLRKLGTWDVDWQPKPKRMRWKTYGRLKHRLNRYQAACTAGIAMQLQAWGSRLDPDLMARAMQDAEGALPRQSKRRRAPLRAKRSSVK
jgi:hypothetical protein